MYRAKESGRDGAHLYTREGGDAMARLSMAGRLRRAAARDEFVLHYQPLVDLKTGAAVGVEALIRWYDGDRGLIMPGDFIPLAERTGLIAPISEWVVEEACRQGRVWHDAGLDLYVSVNLPAAFWEPTAMRHVLDTIESFGLSPDRMMIEITESTASREGLGDAPILAELHERGLRLAIDDFGTGHSSLDRLNRMAVTTLKIDRSFVAGVPNEHSAGVLVKAMLRLADGLGLQALAEGIETEAQRAFLLEHGCPLGQGFLFSPPVAAAQIEPLVLRLPEPPRSGHALHRGVELGVLARLDDARQPVDRIPDVDEAGVDRREPEADRVGRAEVGDDVGALDERPADPPRVGMPERHMRAAALGVARRPEREPELRQALVVDVDRQGRELRRLGAHAADARLGQHLRARVDGRQGEDRRRPGQEPPDPLDRPVLGPHRELVLLREPAPDRRAQLPLEARADVEERGRPRAGVQVLVGAPDGQIGADRVEVDLDRTGRVAQVPEDERARCLSGGRDLGHPRQRAGAVVHRREHDQRRAARARLLDLGRLRAGDGVGGEHAKLAARPGGQALEDVAVGGEVGGVGDDRARPGIERRAGELVEVDGRRVRHEHLPRRRPERGRPEPVADRRRCLDPVVPAGHEPVAPLADPALERGLGVVRDRAERVAVDVDLAPVAEREPAAEARRAGRPRRGPRRPPAWSAPFEPLDHRSPCARAGLEVLEMAVRLDLDQLASRRGGEPAAHLGGTVSSRPPCTSSTGTGSGSRRAGEASR